MHGYGGGRVIRALLSYPCKISIKAILATLKDQIKINAEESLYKSYMSKTLRMINEKLYNVYGGNCITKDFDDILNPKEEDEDERTPEEVIESIRNKLEGGGKN